MPNDEMLHSNQDEEQMELECEDSQSFYIGKEWAWFGTFLWLCLTFPGDLTRMWNDIFFKFNFFIMSRNRKMKKKKLN